jgi:hypothetical protein
MAAAVPALVARADRLTTFTLGQGLACEPAEPKPPRHAAAAAPRAGAIAMVVDLRPTFT